jgi:hypothetical protein
MFWIKAIYNLPAIAHTFFIVDDPLGLLDRIMPMIQSKRQRLYFERTVRCKDCTMPTLDQQWTVKSIHESDFFSSLITLLPSRSILTNSLMQKSSFLELLTMQVSYCSPPIDARDFYSQKVLARISSTDVIEITI